MNSVYSKNTIEIFQAAIDNLKPKFEQQEYGFLDRLMMAGIRVELKKEPSGRFDGQIVTTSYRIDGEYTSIWKTYSPGHFLISDWKKQVMDLNGKCPYYIVKTKLGTFKVRAILREIFEENAKLRDQYADITYDGHAYTVIKICPDSEDDDSWLSGNGKIDIVHTTSIDIIEDFDDTKVDISKIQAEADAIEPVKITSPSKQLEYTDEDIELITEVAGTFI